MFRSLLLSTFFSFSLLMMSCSNQGNYSGSSYKPKAGDQVVIYINKLKPEKYQEGRDLVMNEFPAIIQKSNDTILAYFYENPATYEVGAVQFFHGKDAVRKWNNDPARNELIEKLQPTFSQPLIMYQYDLTQTVSSSPISNQVHSKKRPMSDSLTQ